MYVVIYNRQVIFEGTKRQCDDLVSNICMDGEYRAGVFYIMTSENYYGR